MKVVAWVPIKLNNQRLPGKNTMPLGGKPLCEYMLNTLTKVKELDEIYVYCSDERIVEYLPEGVKFLKRPERLDGSLVMHTEILNEFINTIDADVYLNAHVTNPFITAETIEDGLKHVLSGEYDSACAVQKIDKLLWYDGKPLNFTRENILRTQDASPLYIDANLFIYKRSVAKDLHSRYGNKQYFMELDQFEAIDIDTADDFKLAEIVQKML